LRLLSALQQLLCSVAQFANILIDLRYRANFRRRPQDLSGYLPEQRLRASLQHRRPHDPRQRRQERRLRPATLLLLLHRVVAEVENPAGGEAERSGDAGGAEFGADQDAERASGAVGSSWTGRRLRRGKAHGRDPAHCHSVLRLR
jgi:hypothetical protein